MFLYILSFSSVFVLFLLFTFKWWFVIFCFPWVFWLVTRVFRVIVIVCNFTDYFFPSFCSLFFQLCFFLELFLVFYIYNVLLCASLWILLSIVVCCAGSVFVSLASLWLLLFRLVMYWFKVILSISLYIPCLKVGQFALFIWRDGVVCFVILSVVMVISIGMWSEVVNWPCLISM